MVVIGSSGGVRGGPLAAVGIAGRDALLGRVEPRLQQIECGGINSAELEQIATADPRSQKAIGDEQAVSGILVGQGRQCAVREVDQSKDALSVVPCRRSPSYI